MRYSFALALIALTSTPSGSQTPSKAPPVAPQFAAPHQRGTDTAPVSVKLLNSGKSQLEAAQESTHIAAEKSAQRWSIGLTAATVFVTLGLLVVAVLQWLTLKAQAAIMTKTVDEMGKQERRMAQTVEIAQKQFVASVRPKLAVRRIYFNDPGGSGGPATPSGIYFTVQSRGDAPATITAIYATHRIHPKGLRLPPWVMPMTKELITKVLPAGGQSQEFYPMDDLQRRRVISNYETMMDLNDFYFIGEISFEDANRVERRMAFCRKYAPTTKRFEREDDPDYEFGE